MVKDRTARRIAIAGLVITTIVGGANWFEMHRQVDLIQQGGPELTATGGLSLYHPDTGVWEPLDPSQNVTTQRAATGNLVLWLALTNEGRFQATIDHIGIGTSDKAVDQAPKTNCDYGTKIDLCKLPLDIPPHANQVLYVDLSGNTLQKDLTCNQYAATQLEYVVATTGSPYLVQKLPKSVNWATDCP